MLEVKNFKRSKLISLISDNKKDDEVKKSGQYQDIMSVLKEKIEKRRAILSGNPSSIISHASSSDIKISTQLPTFQIKPLQLNQEQSVTIFKEIVRRMVNSETSPEMISLQEKNLIDAAINYEDMINNGKNSQGKLIHFKLKTNFSYINEELMELIMEIINFHCFTLESIIIDGNFIFSPNLKIFYSSLKLDSAIFLREIDIKQQSTLSEDCTQIILKQLQSSISLKVITRGATRFQTNEILGWKSNETLGWESIENELNYNIELEFATKALPILISCLPKNIVQSIIVDFLIGDLNNPRRKKQTFIF